MKAADMARQAVALQDAKRALGLTVLLRHKWGMTSPDIHKWLAGHGVDAADWEALLLEAESRT